MICLMYNVHVKSCECLCKRRLGSNMCLIFIVYQFSKFLDLLFKPYEIACCKSSVVGFPFQLDELKACSFGMIQIRRSTPRSLWSWYIKWTNESFTRVDLLGPLMCVIRPSDLGSLILIWIIPMEFTRSELITFVSSLFLGLTSSQYSSP